MGRVKFQSPEPELQEYGFISGTSTYRQSLNGIAAWATSNKGLPYEVGAALHDLKEPSLQQPIFPAHVDGNIQEIYVYKADYGAYQRKKECVDAALKGLFHMLLGQCDDGLRGKVKNRSDFHTLERDGDTITLAKNIEEEGYSL